jgi:dipeptidyl aminopeptidase/acylaminoacyl peptidase
MTFVDMQQLRAIGPGNMSADGKQMVYALITPDWKTASTQADLYVVSAERGVSSTKQITFTRDKIETSPKWTPDGQWIVFVSNRDGANHLYAMRPDSGSAPRRLTAGSSPVSTFEFSPDGRTLAYRTGPADAEQLYAIALSDIAAEGDIKPRQLTTHATGVDQWRFTPDGAQIYFLAADAIDRVARERAAKRFTVQVQHAPAPVTNLWVADIATGRATRVTNDTTRSIGDFTMSGDGRWLSFRSVPNDRYKRAPTPEQQMYADLFLLEIATGRTERLSTNEVSWESAASFSPDSRLIAFSAPDDRRTFNQKNMRVYVRPVAEPTAAWRKIGTDFDGDVAVDFWSADSRTIYFDAGVRATSQLFALDVASGKTKQLTDVKGTVLAQSRAPNLPILLIYEDPATPPSAFVVQNMDRVGDRSSWIRVAESNPQANFALGETEEITWRSKDGTSVGGVLVKPVGYTAGKRYPLAVILHGGPHAAEVLNFNGDDNDGPQVYAGAGWMVLIPNYRGSTGYGEKFKLQINGNLLDLSYQDVMAGVDHLIARGMVDSSQMGVLGHSAGGTLGAWILTHTNRFKAISSGAGVVNWMTMWSQSDIQFPREYALGAKPPYADFERWWNQSPIKYVANAKTPTLIYATQDDPRVPSGQARDLYAALRKLGVPTELYIYPGTQHGTPGMRNRAAHGMAEMAWMDYWVRKSGKPFAWETVFATLSDSTPAAPNVQTPVAVSESVMRSYVGEYEFAPGRTAVVTLENGTLFAQPTGQAKSPLVPESTTEFAIRSRDSGLKLRFITDAAGTIGVVLVQNGAERPGKRLVK